MSASAPDDLVPEPAPAPPSPAEPAAAKVAPRARRPFEGWGDATVRGLKLFGRAASDIGRALFLRARSRSTDALTDFQSRPEHTRWRAYALGSYGLIVVLTLAMQLYSPNGLQAQVRVNRVPLPEATVIFLRNDSSKPWKGLKLTLNGSYSYERNELPAGEHMQLNVESFGVSNLTGGLVRAPKDTQVHSLRIECDRGTYEQEFE